MATLSGQKVIATAGTELPLTAATLLVNCPVMVKALAGNTGKIYLGNVAGLVSSSTGLELSAGEVCIFSYVTDLNLILVDSSVNGEGVSWIRLDF